MLIKYFFRDRFNPEQTETIEMKRSDENTLITNKIRPKKRCFSMKKLVSILIVILTLVLLMITILLALYFLYSPTKSTSTLITTDMTKYLTTTTSKAASKIATTTSLIETKGYPRINNNASLSRFSLKIYIYTSFFLHSVKSMP